MGKAKTNKSYAKRLKVTKSGKILARKTGQNHFNSKERHAQKTGKQVKVNFPMTAKEKGMFLQNFK